MISAYRTGRLRMLIPATGIILFCGGCQKQSTPLSPQPANEVAQEDTARGPEVEIERLIGSLKNQDDNQGYSTALKLAKFRSVAIPPLIRALESSDPKTRKWSARALTNMGGGYGQYGGHPELTPAGEPMLDALAKEREPGVAWYLVQAIGTIQPNVDRAMPVLIATLNTNEDRLKVITAETIGSYSQGAVGAKPSLLEHLKSSNDDWFRIHVLTALESIGIDSNDAELIGTLDLSGSPRATADAVRLLLSRPNVVLQFLKRHPQALSNFDGGIHLNALVSVLKDDAPTNAQLREYLRNRDDLPSIAMVHIGEESYLPVLRSRIAAADPHRRTYLEACARALGAEPSEVVKISEADSGSFRPKSAHPNTNNDRWAPGGGHGDGYTNVLITGRLVMPDGSPAKAPQFFHANDRMLLSQNRRDPAPLLRYDETTGRFIFSTDVFAAYSMVQGQKEPGPYQTGEAKTVIEAEGARPLTVSFYDEMPDVEITLTPK